MLQVFVFTIIMCILVPLKSTGQYLAQRSDIRSENYVPLSWFNQESIVSDYKRNIDIQLRGVTFSDALKAIAGEAGVRLSYDINHLPKEEISLIMHQVSVIDAFEQVLHETNLEALASYSGQVVIARKTEDQEDQPYYQTIVTGSITDATNGDPLPGVNIIVSGSEEVAGYIIGTQSDINGNFSLEIPEGLDTLIFTYIGYQRNEVLIADETELNIQLVPIMISGDELVVIGYGTARERDVTGAISSVTTEKLRNESPNSVQDILRGNIPGLNVGLSTSAKGGGSLQVRGQNSLTAGSDPLIVLDGSIYPGQLSDINPNDIESIDVMKDASSAAVFGANAASGVILITTTKGGLTDGATIRINSSVGVTTMSVNQPVYGPHEFINWREDVMKSIHAGGYEPHRFSNPTNLPSNISLNEWMAYDGSSGDPETVWLQRLHLQPIEIENYKAGRSVNWYDMVFQDGIRQDHNISMSGRKEDMQYFWSLGYINNEGIVVGDEFTTIRTRLNLEGNVNEFLKVGINSQFADRNESALSVNWGQITSLSPWGSEYDENGDYKWRPNEEVRGGVHPFYDRSHRNWFHRERNLHAILFGELDLPFGFTFRTNFTPRYVFIQEMNHLESTHEEWGRRGGIASRRQYSVFHWQIDNILSWNQNFNGIHNFNVTMLANLEKYQNWNDTMENSEFDPQDNLGYHNIGAGTFPIIGSNDQVETADALMGRILYSLYDRYTVNFSLRRDGYSAFGQSNPHGFFPALSFGWIFSDEDFINADWLDFGRVRLSWGSSGNRNIGRYAAVSDLTTGKYFYETLDGTLYQVNQLYVNRMSNANLKWESTETINVGLDFSLFNRVDGSVEVYDMTTTDLLVQRSLPDILGFDWVYDNLGEVQNRGFEFNLNSYNLIRENITWSTNFNFHLNRNKIVSLYGDLDEFGSEMDDVGNQWFIGRSIDEIWHYRTLGIWQKDEAEEAARYGVRPGDYKLEDVNDDGQYTREDRQFLGHTSPRFRWSLRNEFRLYENFDVAFTIYSNWGHKSSFNRMQNASGFLDRTNSYVQPYWTEENPGDEWARLYSSSGGSGGFNVYRDRSFIRFENFSVAYNVPSSITEKFRAQNLRLYVNMRNLGFHAPEWDFWDPENSGPTPRYITFGIDLTL